MDPKEIRAAERLLGHRFADKGLLLQALTHASVADSRLQSNERLEFLGDAVLGIVICDHLYESYEDLLEGELTKIKSSVVSRRTCADIADELGLSELLRLGKGLADRAALPKSVVAAVYEALRAAGSGHQQNFKSVLQQTAQEVLRQQPQYIVLDEKGPDHAKCFEVCVEIGAKRYRSCWGASKKQAEQQAALGRPSPTSPIHSVLASCRHRLMKPGPGNQRRRLTGLAPAVRLLLGRLVPAASHHAG
ncbi:MAG: ribonuclease III family protein [Planctomycetota bacterium]|jgi:ribonuclease-3